MKRRRRTIPKTAASLREQLAGKEIRLANRADRVKDLALLAVALVAASVLLLANLGNQYLWQDEAETALVAKTVLSHGIPLKKGMRPLFLLFPDRRQATGMA